MRASPYASVIRDREVARLLPGFALSYLGDGMSAIAISWLALQIAPPDHRGLWVALALAAYTLPGALGTFALGGVLRHRPGAQLVSWDSWLRAGCLGVVAVCSGSLGIWPLVALLAASSVLHAWGSAGTFTMVTELLPERDHLPANALLGMLVQVGVLLGPPAAGLLIAHTGAGPVLAVDAATFAALALTCRSAVRRAQAAPAADLPALAPAPGPAAVLGPAAPVLGPAAPVLGPAGPVPGAAAPAGPVLGPAGPVPGPAGPVLGAAVAGAAGPVPGAAGPVPGAAGPLPGGAAEMPGGAADRITVAVSGAVADGGFATAAKDVRGAVAAAGADADPGVAAVGGALAASAATAAAAVPATAAAAAVPAVAPPAAAAPAAGAAAPAAGAAAPAGVADAGAAAPAGAADAGAAGAPDASADGGFATAGAKCTPGAVAAPGGVAAAGAAVAPDAAAGRGVAERGVAVSGNDGALAAVAAPGAGAAAGISTAAEGEAASAGGRTASAGGRTASAGGRTASGSGEAASAGGRTPATSAGSWHRGASRLAGFRLIAGDRRLAGLLGLTFGFYVLYGPFEVGLPVYVADYQHAPASHLAWYFTAFGAGAVAGGLVAGYLRSWPLAPATAGIVIGVGAALLPLGLGAPDAVSVVCYALAGLIYAPYGSLTATQFQRAADRSSLPEVLAARRTVMILSGPAGTGLGGLLVTGLGPREAFLIAALATLALGGAAAVLQPAR